MRKAFPVYFPIERQKLRLIITVTLRSRMMLTKNQRALTAMRCQTQLYNPSLCLLSMQFKINQSYLKTALHMPQEGAQFMHH